MKRNVYLAGLILVLAPYISLLSHGDQAFLFRDLSNVWLPYKATWLAAAAELWRIPHWDPLHAGGARFIADLNYGPLYPLNFLLFFFRWLGGGLARGLSLWIVFHHLLIYSGFFLYFQYRRYRPLLCLAGALAVAWMGAAMSSDNFVHTIGAQASVGFFLFFWTKALKHPSMLSLFGASLALAWPIYSGDPQYSYVLGFFASGMLVFGRGSFLTRATSLASLGFLTALVAAPQLLPTLDFLSHSRRILDAMSDSDRLAWSLSPVRLLELFVPLPFGSTPATWRGPGTQAGEPPFLFSLYAGAVVSALGGLRLFLPRPRRRVLRKLAAPAGGFLLLSLLTVGSNSPVYLVTSRLLPLWSGFRFPERMGYFVSLLLVLFAIGGAERALRLRGRMLKVPLGVTLLLFCVLAVGFWVYLHQMGYSTFPVFWSLLLVAAVLLLVYFRPRNSQALLAGLILFDLVSVATRLVWVQSSSLAEASRYPWVQKILTDQSASSQTFSEGGASRFFSSIQSPLSEAGISAEERSTYSAWAGMKFNTPSAWGISLVRGHTSFTPDRPILSHVGESDVLARRTLDLYSTRYFLQLVNGVPAPVVNRQALPVVHFPNLADFAAGGERQLENLLKDPAWNIEERVLLEGEGEPLPVSEPKPKVTGLRRSWDQMDFVVTAAELSPKRWLLLNEAYDRHWVAEIDGRPLKLARANGWAMAFVLPEIESKAGVKVQLIYTDPWYRCGLVLLAVWCLGLVFALRSSRKSFLFR